MCRDNLNNLPDIRLPEGYALECFQPGYEEHWNTIIQASFGQTLGMAKFEDTMKNDPAFRPERIMFIKHGNEFVATASAWFKPMYETDMGNIHQVGVLPTHQGKGLAYWISLAALHHLAQEGFSKATLETDDFRIPAIKTYFKLWFVPVLVHENQRKRWKDIFLVCNRNAEFDSKFASILSGKIHTFKKKKKSSMLKIITLENKNETKRFFEVTS
jgi:mycothiol synthase